MYQNLSNVTFNYDKATCAMLNQFQYICATIGNPLTGKTKKEMFKMSQVYGVPNTRMRLESNSCCRYKFFLRSIKGR